MTAPALELRNVAVGYGRVAILDNLDLTVAPGRWVALVGPNASGKTTLLRTIGGRLPALAGSIRISGEPAGSSSAPPPGLAIAPDELPAFLTVEQALEIHAAAYALPAIPPECAGLARRLGLDVHAHTLIRHASLGTRQKLAVILALMRQPGLLLLDEVFNGLDFPSAIALRGHLREQVERNAMTVMLATHALDVVLRCCDELVLVDPGKPLRSWEVAGFAGADPLAALERALAGEAG